MSTKGVERAEKRKAVRAALAEKRKSAKVARTEQRKATRAARAEERKTARAARAEEMKAAMATKREAARAARAPVMERGLTGSDTLPALRSNRLAALRATPRCAERIETFQARFVNKATEEFISTGWTVVETSSSRTNYFFNDTTVTVRFRKE